MAIRSTSDLPPPKRRREIAVSEQLVKGTVIPVVLALLRDGPRYGYEMVQNVNARSNGALEWREGTLYPVLHRMEADGLISAQWKDYETPAGGNRRRRYYALTGAGRRELARRSAEWKSFAAVIGDLLGRVLNIGAISKAGES